MKKTRWRKIIKVTEFHATKLMNQYYWSENVSMQWPNGGLGEKREMEILETVHHYANLIERTSKIDMYQHPKEWVQELTNFTD